MSFRAVVTVCLICVAALSPACARSWQPTSSSASPGIRQTDAPIRLGVDARMLSDEPWTYAGSRGHVIRTRNYRIYTTLDDQILRTRTASFLEYALAHYRSAIVLLPGPPRRMDTYVMASRTQWQTLTRHLMGKQAEMLIKIPRGGFASRGIGVYYDIGLRDTLAIAAHEGWHQYTQRTFGQTLPVWLEEGLASYMEGHRWNGTIPEFRPWANTERFDQLRRAQRAGSLLPLVELLNAQPQDFLDSSDDAGLTYYAQVWALTHFLDQGAGEKYNQSLRDLLLDATAGTLSRALELHLGRARASATLAQRAGTGVFLAYFNTDLEQVAVEYSQFVRLVTATGSREFIVQGKNPIVRRPQHE